MSNFNVHVTRARGAKLRTVLGVIVSCGINGAGGENHKA
jgi:hypothetical protein